MDNEFELQFIKFLSRASEVCGKERGKQFHFECPQCGGEAVVSRSEYNGHLWASCSKCGIKIQQ